MALEIIRQARRNDVSLRDQLAASRKELFDLCLQEGIMGTGQENRVHIAGGAGNLREQLIHILFYKIVRAGLVMLVVLHERYPERAGLLKDLYFREEFGDLDGIGIRQ